MDAIKYTVLGVLVYGAVAVLLIALHLINLCNNLWGRNTLPR